MGVGVGGAGEWSQGLKLKVDILEWQQLSLQCAAAVFGAHGAHGAPKVLSFIAFRAYEFPKVLFL